MDFDQGSDDISRASIVLARLVSGLERPRYLFNFLPGMADTQHGELKKLYPQLSHLIGEQVMEAAKLGITITDPKQPGNIIVYVNQLFSE